MNCFYNIVLERPLLLLQEVGNARLGEGDRRLISPKTSTPQNQPIKRKIKNSRSQKVGEPHLGQLISIVAALETLQQHIFNYKTANRLM